jgi:hypothetical protein
MLGDGQQFDMGVAHFFKVRDQPIRKLEVTQISVILFGNSRPRPKVNLINTHRLLRPVPRFSFRDPGVITPFKTIEIKDQGSRLHSILAEEREGIAFQDDVAETVADLVLVVGFFTDPWNEYSQIPASMRLRIGWVRPSQLLKSPTALTR